MLNPAHCRNRYHISSLSIAPHQGQAAVCITHSTRTYYTYVHPRTRRRLSDSWEQAVLVGAGGKERQTHTEQHTMASSCTQQQQQQQQRRRRQGASTTSSSRALLTVAAAVALAASTASAQSTSTGTGSLDDLYGSWSTGSGDVMTGPVSANPTHTHTLSLSRLLPLEARAPSSSWDGMRPSSWPWQGALQPAATQARQRAGSRGNEGA